LSSSPIAHIDQMQENLIAYFRIFAGLPGVTFVEEDATWFVNARAEPGNHILCHAARGAASRVSICLDLVFSDGEKRL